MTSDNRYKIPAVARPVSLGPGRPAIGGGAPVICVPLVAQRVADAVEQARRLAATGPDLIEVRLDYLQDLPVAETGALLNRLKDASRLPLLATCRLADEGGARPVEEAQRLSFLQAALQSRAVRLVDIEFATAPAERAALQRAAQANEVAVICSYHDFGATALCAELVEIMKRMAATGADIVKLAVMPNNPQDTLELLEATRQASRELAVPLVTMALGGLGGFTRLAGPFFGSALSFAIGENSSAPGQIKIDLVREVWQNWLVRS